MSVGGHSESSSLYLATCDDRVATLWQRGKSTWLMHIDSLAKEIHDREVPSYHMPGRRYLYYLTVLVTITEDKDEKEF